jgi:Spy/CpxP family protein refolding chaperone
LALAVALLIACPALAAKKADKKPECPAAKRIAQITKGLTLTDEEKTKLADLAKDYSAKFTEAEKNTDVLTQDQKTARDAATTKAKADGKKGKELRQAVDAAVTLTDEQKTKQSAAKKALRALDKEFRGKVLALLTPEQQDQVKAARSLGKKAK